MRESLKEFLEIIESCNQPKGWKQMGLTETEKETLINAILDQFSKLK